MTKMGVASASCAARAWLDSCKAVLAWRFCPGGRYVQFEFDPSAETYGVPTGIWFDANDAPLPARKALAAAIAEDANEHRMGKVRRKSVNNSNWEQYRNNINRLEALMQAVNERTRERDEARRAARQLYELWPVEYFGTLGGIAESFPWLDEQDECK